MIMGNKNWAAEILTSLSGTIVGVPVRLFRSDSVALLLKVKYCDKIRRRAILLNKCLSTLLSEGLLFDFASWSAP